jgi:hypothetical protein
VTAVDRAGNVSEPVVVEALAAPDPRYANATVIRDSIPEVLRGVQRLSADHGPYRVDLPTRVATDGVLLIDPGVELRVAPGASLAVLGELHGFGEASRPIRVEDVEGQGYSEFLVLQTERPVVIRHFEFTGGGLPVRILAGRPLIETSRFLDNRFSALSLAGTARPTIRACRIRGAGSSGVVVEGQAQPVFIGNSFEENNPFHLQNGSSYQIDLSDNTFVPAASSTTVLGDVLFGEES